MTNFIYDKLRTIHVELTNNCNAGCPLCPRNIFGGIQDPNLIISEISYDNFVEWFGPVVKNIRTWIFCGGWGDPCISKDIIPIVRYIREQKNDAIININTNGGMRQKEFWIELGNLLNYFGGRITFSIDGLEDTNHLYRQYVNWNKLMENVKAYISTGSNAYWDYLIFKHNEHQLEEAEKFSKQLGFSQFIPKRAMGVEGNKKIGVHNRQGKRTHYLESGLQEDSKNMGEGIEVKGSNDEEGIENFIKQLKNKKRDKIEEKIDPAVINFNPNTFEIDKERHTSLNKKTVQCRVLSHPQHGLQEGENSTYISSKGHVVPCCWMGTEMYMGMPTFELTQFKHFLYDHGHHNISLHHNTLKDIYESNYFKKYEDSWSIPDIRKGKLAICAVNCGENNALLDLWKHNKNRVTYKWARDGKN